MDHQDDENRHSNEKIQQTRKGRRGRDDQPREIDLANQMGAAHQAVAGGRQGIGKIGPRQQPSIDKYRIGHVIRRHFSQPSEKNGEDHHCEKRLDDGPEAAQNRLLIADLDVAFDQKIEEFAEFPEFLQIDGNPAFFGFDNCQCWFWIRHCPDN